MIFSILLFASTALAAPAPFESPSRSAATSADIRQKRDTHNDFSCKSQSHPNPVVFLHGFGATYYEDLNIMQDHLQSDGYCTFSQTYGAYEAFPYVGGLKPINESALEIAAFIKLVHAQTGAEKIDIVGHSEGAFMSLYVPKFEAGISEIVENIVPIAPPTHGTSFGSLYELAQVLGVSGGVSDVLAEFGCPACADLLTDGPAVERLNDGEPIVQPGNSVTVITSKYDELVTPTTTSFIDEASVVNEYVQDKCPTDPVGHIGEAYDLNVENLVRNALDQTLDRTFDCKYGSPGK